MRYYLRCNISRYFLRRLTNMVFLYLRSSNIFCLKQDVSPAVVAEECPFHQQRLHRLM